jgi:hypothetical protein
MARRTLDPEHRDVGEDDPAAADAHDVDARARSRERRAGTTLLRRRHDRERSADVSASARVRQREVFGGISWLSALVGWLAAAGLAAILTGVLGAAGAVLAVTDLGHDVTDSDAETIGLGGAIALLVVLAIAYWFGGYAAGRMARFDGARQGIAVWICGILAAGAVALLALIGGAEYNVLDRLNLPRVPIDSGTLTTAGLVALLGSIVVTLAAAMAGGKSGERFHRKVDRAGLAD